MRPRTNRSAVALLLLLLILAVWFYATRDTDTTVIVPAPPTAVVQNPPTGAPVPPTAYVPNGPTVRPSQPSTNRNLALGNPSGAAKSTSQPDNYLIERPQYVVSYNRSRGTPNWVSWQLTQKDLGPVERSNIFVSDTTLPKGWYRVATDDYTSTGYDRGHLCPSADRTATQKDNQATFTLTNIMPQAPGNNRVTWEHLESYSRSLVNDGHTLYIIAGVDGTIGTIDSGRITVPRYTWKIIVVMPPGATNISQITAATQVIAVRVPNALTDKLGDWEQYQVPVSTIEKATGYSFFSNLAPNIQRVLKTQQKPVPAS